MGVEALLPQPALPPPLEPGGLAAGRLELTLEHWRGGTRLSLCWIP